MTVWSQTADLEENDNKTGGVYLDYQQWMYIIQQITPKRLKSESMMGPTTACMF